MKLFEEAATALMDRRKSAAHEYEQILLRAASSSGPGDAGRLLEVGAVLGRGPEDYESDADLVRQREQWSAAAEGRDAAATEFEQVRAEVKQELADIAREREEVTAALDARQRGAEARRGAAHARLAAANNAANEAEKVRARLNAAFGIA